MCVSLLYYQLGAAQSLQLWTELHGSFVLVFRLRSLNKHPQATRCSPPATFLPVSEVQRMDLPLSATFSLPMFAHNMGNMGRLRAISRAILSGDVRMRRARGALVEHARRGAQAGHGMGGVEGEPEGDGEREGGLHGK